ncbi:unnamed protein product [Sphagnum jensenii]|uniref:Rho GTPase-activating protein n=1 Tax=Sphagnum jensenii TaxID=128206 RepID=A0ABP1A464_9BRYO
MSAAVSRAPFERSRNRGSNLVYKSGPLFISSKGLGWKSWKRRWFILTRTSLVFLKNDPNAVPQKANDLNSTLGGIDLNNSGSVLVRAEKKLLTVLFPDGRAFTLKAETVEDVEEWKEALEKAIEAAPNAALVVGHETAFRNDSHDAFEGFADHGRDRRSVKSLVVGRPILLALEDIDGSPSFLEKALCFIEQHGVRVEGILRQSADVDDVDQRVKEYEQGRNQFTPDEDAHVIGDCIKHVLRELPSSPVPTTCCTALLEAHRLEGKEGRLNAMRRAILETFPEPNRRLLQRLLRMMRAVSLHTAENRMTASAVAACMAPLLLRPLLAGECGLEDDSEVSADNATQLLAATTAANNAQAIVTMLLEDYDSLFEEEDVQRAPPSPQMYGHLEASASDASSEDDDDDDNDENEALHVIRDLDSGYHDASNDLHEDIDEDAERTLSGTLSESSGNLGSDLFDYKVFEGVDSDNEVSGGFASLGGQKGSTKPWPRLVNLGSDEQSTARSLSLENGGSLNTSSTLGHGQSPWGDRRSPPLSNTQSGGHDPNSKVKPRPSTSSTKRTSLWGLSSANNKNTNPDVNDSSGEEELAIHRLEVTRNDLRTRIAKEAKGNAILQASLEIRKQALHDRRLALEQDVARLQEQLQAERDLRAALEIGLNMSAAQLSAAQTFDSKTRAEVEEIAAVEADVAHLKQKVADLHLQLNQQRQQQHGMSVADSSERQHRVKSLQAQQRILQQELEITLALCNHEKQRNNEEALLAERTRNANLRRRSSPPPDTSVASDWRTLRPPAGPSAAGRQFAWRHQPDPSNLLDDANADHKGASTSDASEARVPPSQQQSTPTPSSALVELTTRLDFFKERRSQLMNQLNSLDPSLVPSSLSGHDLIPASP